MVGTRKIIHKVAQFISDNRVDQHVYAWEEKAVFWTSFVEIGEVYTHPPLSIGLLDQDYIGQPIGIADFLDELCLEELLDLISNSCIPL